MDSAQQRFQGAHHAQETFLPQWGRNPGPYDDQSARPSRARLILRAAAGTILAAWFTAALHNTLALVLGAVLTASVLCGVVYPAVWAHCRKRRRAARRVLRDVLRWTLGRL